MKRNYILACLLVMFASLCNAQVTVQTPNFLMNEMPNNTTKPYLTFNAAIELIDAFMQPTLKVYPASATPTVNDPTNGDLFIVPVDATEDWADQDNKLALMINDDWFFVTPKIGWSVIAGVSDTVFDGVQNIQWSGSVWKNPSIMAQSTLTHGTYQSNSWLFNQTGSLSVIGYGSDITNIRAISDDHNMTIVERLDQSTNHNLMWSWMDSYNGRYAANLYLNGFGTAGGSLELQNIDLHFKDTGYSGVGACDEGESSLYVSNGSLMFRSKHDGVTKDITIANFDTAP